MLQEELTHEDLVARLGRLAQEALPLWGIPKETPIRLINLSENATYRIDLPEGPPRILRVHRVDYHSKQAIASELAWLAALRHDGGVLTPPVIAGLDGEEIQSHKSAELERPRFMVLFGFLEGEEPDENQDLIGPFETLGGISAKLHIHARSWPRPAGFERLTWDFQHMLGATPNWGDWRAAPAMDSAALALLERQAATIERRLAAFGKGPERYGLIHADLRLANLLLHGASTRVIDFDDCGFGWNLYDFATAVSFFEESPQVPALAESWVKGYRRHLDLPAEDEAEIPTFVVLRRMVLLAWVGSHSETDLAKEQGPAYTRDACGLAERYLSEFG
ncbi:MAG: phosphotransferase [Rhodospirillales bacterium]